MKKASRVRKHFDSPYDKRDDGGMDATEHEELPFQVSVLKSSKFKARKVVLPDEPSPHDGLTSQESEDALLQAILPTLPKQGLSVRS